MITANLSVPEVAAELGVNQMTVCELVWLGELESIEVDGHRVVPQSCLETYIMHRLEQNQSRRSYNCTQ